MGLSGIIKSRGDAAAQVTVGTQARSAAPEPEQPSRKLDDSSREKLAARIARRAAERGADARMTPVERAESAYGADFREAIELGGARYAMLQLGGADAIRGLLQRSDEHWRRTGRAPTLVKLLDEAEDDIRAAVRKGNEALQHSKSHQSPEAKKTRVTRVIDAALTPLRAQERSNNAPLFQRSAVRRETETDLRARTRAAIEKAWRNER